MANYGYEFGAAGGPGVAGPLIGGGVATVGALAAKLIFKGKPGIVKWAPTIGLGLAGALGTLLAVRKRTRSTGISALITAALVTVPQQVETMLGAGTMKGYLGAITAEEVMGGAEGIELMESNEGLGVTTTEEVMNGAEGIDLLGQGGAFGSNFFSQE